MGKWSLTLVASVGLGTGCPLSEGQREREENLKRRPQVRQASNPAWLKSVPAKSLSFLEPQNGTLFGNRTVAAVISWAFNEIELVLLDKKREQTQVTERSRPGEGGDGGGGGGAEVLERCIHKLESHRVAGSHQELGESGQQPPSGPILPSLDQDFGLHSGLWNWGFIFVKPPSSWYFAWLNSALRHEDTR